jgi:hypothetical protein
MRKSRRKVSARVLKWSDAKEHREIDSKYAEQRCEAEWRNHNTECSAANDSQSIAKF